MSMGHTMWRVLGDILCNHDPKVKVKRKKADIFDGVPSILVKCILTIILIVFCVQDVITDETADSHVQTRQDLHCFSMWKK